MWLGDRLLAETAGAVVDVVAARLKTVREERQFRRLWEQTGEVVAGRVEDLVRRRFPSLPEHEQLAAIAAVEETFAAAPLRQDDLYSVFDLDPVELDHYLRRTTPGPRSRAALSGRAERLFDLLLRECCSNAVEVARALPRAEISALTEVLRRQSRIADDLRTVLERLPDRQGAEDFEIDYRQLVANQLDRVEFFGASMLETSRRYPLSVAYLSLMASSTTGEVAASAGARRVEDVLAGSRRLFIRGEAGLGKTTLLQWVAVNCARKSFRDRLADWGGSIPFMIKLRRYSRTDLPRPEQFLDEVGQHIAAEMPTGWVQRQLRSSHAIVLVDGVDEVPEQRRRQVRDWLAQLVSTFGSARYIVTSRPAAVAAQWLRDEQFTAVDLEPMTRQDIPVFIERWHDAMRDQAADPQHRDELSHYENRLIDAVHSSPHLIVLAAYPLLCALLCALHRDRRGHLPGNRMELYEVALHMLLERRDQERNVSASPELTRTDRTLLLQDLAYWLVRNGEAEATVSQAIALIDAKLAGMAQIDASAQEVYRSLLVRTGVLREPAPGQVNFVHKSFQEYLAAKAAVDAEDLGL